MQERVTASLSAGGRRSGPRRRRTERQRAHRPVRLTQAKLTVGAAGDRYEREADPVADRVMAVIQRLSRAPGPAPVPTSTSHRCGPACVHRHAGHAATPTVRGRGDEGGDLDAHLTSRVRQASGGARRWPPGAALDGSRVRRYRLRRRARAHQQRPRAAHRGQRVHPRPGHPLRPRAVPPGRAVGHLAAQPRAHPRRAAGRRRGHRRPPAIRRHSSKEHFILGAHDARPDPRHRRRQGGQGNPHRSARRRARPGQPRSPRPCRSPPGRSPTRRTTPSSEQIDALEQWRTVANADGGPTAQEINKGGTAYDHDWGGQLLTVTAPTARCPAPSAT